MMPAIPTTKPKVTQDKGLSLPQVRVLHALYRSSGPLPVLTRNTISALCGNKTTVVVSRALGYSDPEARAKFEQTKDGGFRLSLLSLQLVREIQLDICGVEEIGYQLTPLGKSEFEALGEISLPELRD